MKPLIFFISFVYSIPFYFGTYKTDWITYREYLINHKYYSLSEFFTYTFRTEYGFDLFMYVFMKIFNNPELFLFCNVFLTTSLMLLGLVKLLKIKTPIAVLFLSIALFIDTPLALLNTNIIRQNLAMGFVVFLIAYKRKFIPLIGFFHISSLFFIINPDRFKKPLILLLILVIFFRNNILTFLGQYLHNVYDTPNVYFLIVLIISSILVRPSSSDLSNFGILISSLVLFFWPLTQFSNRFILYGHAVVISAIFLIIKIPFLKRNV